MQLNGCPADGDLSAFATGALASADVDRVADHVTGCVDCQARLARLDDEPDEVVSAVRRRRRAGGRPGDVGPGADPRATTAASGAADDDGTAGTVGAATDGDLPDDWVGNYQVRQLLGEGGFGTVFLADQTYPLRRQVALKLIKPGMDTRQVMARFQAEREALALMDHPHIARVLDAGTTGRGRPYFVMELARGVPITAWCDDQRLPVRRRLELFALVCDAVQHAHTKGIIHRDIKPTNVLVTVRDDVPVPKVIDFGIAKAVGGRLADQAPHTPHTLAGHFIGTPEYMSPEQADGGGDVDARTDVYSLGVLLYELLTGTTPLEPKDVRSNGIAGVARAIREADPPRPSTRLSALGGALPAVADRRGADARRLGQAVRGELDWIVMKCLEKDRGRRYETANALSTDVRRYLADEPVRAGPPGAAYQARKFVRRHRAGVGAAAAVAAAVVAGLVLAVWGMVRATNERNRATREWGRAEQAVRGRDAADRARRLAAADAVATASPAGAIATVDALRTAPGDGGTAPQPVLDVFRQRLAAGRPGSVERLRAACALALLGEPTAGEVAGAVEWAPASEGPLVIAALAAAAGRPGARVGGGGPAAELAALAAAEKDLRVRARYAIALLFVGDDAPARRMLRPGPDPTPWGAFVEEFGQWHGHLGRLPDVFRRLDHDDDPDARAGLCLAVARVDRQAVGADERQAVLALLADRYARDPSGGVHGACDHALRQWGAAPPAVAPPAGGGWLVTPSGLTMVCVPAGFGLLGQGSDGGPDIPVFFTRPLLVSAREVPLSLVRQFADDPAVPADDKPAALQGRRTGAGDVAVNLTAAEAARFCNWLSARDGCRPYYPPDGLSSPAWEPDESADGYRLPTAPEWEYAARAGAATRYACSEDGQYLESCTTLALSRGRGAASRPNPWGLFDTLGGVWEMCWPVDWAVQPNPPGHYDFRAFPRPVVDPRPADRQPAIVFRGGADDSGTFDLGAGSTRGGSFVERSVSVGFRVVRPVPSAAAESPPADAGDLWVRAAAARPASPFLAAQAAGQVDRIGAGLGRSRRFAEAIPLFEKTVETKPGDAVAWFHLAVLRLVVGDPAGYQAACKALMGLASDADTDALPRDRAARAVLLAPDLRPGPDQDAAAGQAARAWEIGQTHAVGGWYRLADGMAAYRAGRYDAAAEQLAAAHDQLGTARPPGQALARLFLAMAQHRAGRSADARASYDAADAAIRQAAPLDADNWGDDWIDWLVCHVARREAERVLGIPSSGPPLNPDAAATRPAGPPATSVSSRS